MQSSYPFDEAPYQIELQVPSKYEMNFLVEIGENVSL